MPLLGTWNIGWPDWLAPGLSRLERGLARCDGARVAEELAVLLRRRTWLALQEVPAAFWPSLRTLAGRFGYECLRGDDPILVGLFPAEDQPALLADAQLAHGRSVAGFAVGVAAARRVVVISHLKAFPHLGLGLPKGCEEPVRRRLKHVELEGLSGFVAALLERQGAASALVLGDLNASWEDVATSWAGRRWRRLAGAEDKADYITLLFASSTHAKASWWGERWREEWWWPCGGACAGWGSDHRPVGAASWGDDRPGAAPSAAEMSVVVAVADSGSPPPRPSAALVSGPQVGAASGDAARPGATTSRAAGEAAIAAAALVFSPGLGAGAATPQGPLPRCPPAAERLGPPAANEEEAAGKDEELPPLEDLTPCELAQPFTLAPVRTSTRPSCVRACVRACVRVRACMIRTHARERTHARTCARTQTHTHTHTHILRDP